MENKTTIIIISVCAVLLLLAVIIIADIRQAMKSKRRRALKNTPPSAVPLPEGHCPICGSTIPEGYQICPTCEWWREIM